MVIWWNASLLTVYHVVYFFVMDLNDLTTCLGVAIELCIVYFYITQVLFVDIEDFDYDAELGQGEKSDIRQ